LSRLRALTWGRSQPSGRLNVAEHRSSAAAQPRNTTTIRGPAMQGRWPMLAAGPHLPAEPAGGAWDRDVPPCPRAIPPREAAPHQRQPPQAGPPGSGAPIRFAGAPRCGGAPSTEELLLEVDR